MNNTRKRSEERTPVPDHLRQSGLASPAQVQYLENMRDSKDLSKLSKQQRDWLAKADFSKLTGGRTGQASRVIEQLKDLPWLPRGTYNTPQGPTASRQQTGYPPVNDGRYAVPKGDGTLMFYSVKNGRSQVFLDVWASAERHPIRNPNEKLRILTAIANDPDAGPRFGREIGACYKCGRVLTDELSRQLGIGPVCREGI